MRTELLIISGSYPYDIAKEHSFLGRELPYLVRRFDRVVLVPQYVGGVSHQLPASVLVDDSFARAAESAWRRALMTAAGGALLAAPLVPSALSSLHQHPSRLAARVLAAAAGRAGWISRWLRSRARNSTRMRRCVYTYWFDAMTTGAAMSRDSFDLLISRAHGLDVYEERHEPAFIPYRARTLALVDKVFTVSADGATYLRNRYPASADRICVARLGTNRQDTLTPGSTDRVLRVVSCSSIIPLKRVHLILEGCCELAKLGRRVEWTHFGDGPGLRDLHVRARALPEGLSVSLVGAMPNEAVLARYRSGTFDVFVNASTTEGVPVAMMEAMSFGIPVVAPRVGGIPELIGTMGGVLLPPTIEPVDLARAVLACCGTPQIREANALGARRSFAEHCDAQRNYESFAEGILSSLLQRGSATTSSDDPPNSRIAVSGEKR